MHKLSEQKLNISKLFCQEAQPTKQKQNANSEQDEQRMEKFQRLLDEQIIDYNKLAELSWNGIPPTLRKVVWPILLKYTSIDKEAQEQQIYIQRKQYYDMVDAYFQDSDRLDQQEKIILQNVVNDVKGINMNFLKQQKLQIMLVRILFLWNIRNPQISYFKNFSHLLLPLLQTNIDLNDDTQSTEDLKPIEADMYWCFTFMLDPIKKYFQIQDGEGQGSTFISQEVTRILTQMNVALIQHWRKQGFIIAVVIQKWIQQLMLSLFDHQFALRIYDTLISEGQDYANFIIFLICAIILKFSAPLLKLNEINSQKFLLEDISTRSWNLPQIEILFAEAYSYKSLYQH